MTDLDKFKEKISKINPNDILPLDETGMNDNEVLDYGWAQKSQRLYGLKKSRKSKRVSVSSC